MIKSHHIHFLLVILCFLITSCTSETQETIDKTNKTLPNGKHLIVEKITAKKTSIGYFSGHNYGTTRSFTYKFSIKQDDIDWDGGSGEPKKIIFYKDSVYVYYLKEKQIPFTIIDSANNNTPITTYEMILKPVYEKHIDNRYFFKLFGDDYWSEITQENYLSVKEISIEYDIPNDNELILQYSPQEIHLKDSIETPVIINK